jgi:hypothetical protein
VLRFDSGRQPEAHHRGRTIAMIFKRTWRRCSCSAFGYSDPRWISHCHRIRISPQQCNHPYRNLILRPALDGHRTPILASSFFLSKEQSMKSTLFGLATSLMLAASTSVIAQTSSPPPAATPSGQAMWYSHQADEMRASKLIGTKVVNTANESIGDINEIVLGKDGKVAAIIIGVGGFLGLGERLVAVNFDSIRMSRDSNNNLVLTVNTTKDILQNAPAWRWETTPNKQ